MAYNFKINGFWSIQVNVIFCEKRRGEREKKREKEREKKERKRREKIWIRISKHHEDTPRMLVLCSYPSESKYEDDNNDKKNRQIIRLHYFIMRSNTGMCRAASALYMFQNEGLHALHK